MYVYAEQLLLENLIINYIILYATKFFTKSDTSKMRIFLASLIGSIYTLIVFFPSVVFMLKFVAKVIVAVVIIKVAFKPKNIRSFIKLMATFHLVAFTFAGISLSLLYMTDIDTHISDGIFYISNFKIKKLVMAIGFGLILFQLSFEYIKNKNVRADNLVCLKVIFKNKEISLKGLVDTGNSLKDPINKLPVIVVEFVALKELFPISVQEMFTEYSEKNLDLYTNLLCTETNDFKFRLIPFKSLGKEDGMIIGFKPDKVLIEIGEEDKVRELIIAIYNKSLSSDDEYEALLHPDIIT